MEIFILCVKVLALLLLVASSETMLETFAKLDHVFLEIVL